MQTTNKEEKQNSLTLVVRGALALLCILLHWFESSLREGLLQINTQALGLITFVL